MSVALTESAVYAAADSMADCVAHLRSALPLIDFLLEHPDTDGAAAFDLDVASRSVAVAISLLDSWALGDSTARALTGR